MRRRLFTRTQRSALFIAADGKCQVCGDPLVTGWHADHERPYSKGGATDVANGQALCAACNLRKGNKFDMTQDRDWQRQAQTAFFKHGEPPRDFTVSATPGAGKTRLALTLAQQLLMGRVERVVVVVPTDALRQQWADAASAAGLQLMPVYGDEDYVKAGYVGCVVTYAQLSRGAGSDLMRRSTRVPTLAILDELHHAGKDRSWGEGLRYALDLATHRLALTGTPWRRDAASPIPFMRYGDDGLVEVDFTYEYGEAVAAGVCRRVEFHAYDGDGRWIECGKVTEASLGADLRDEDVSGVLDAVYHPSQTWMPTLLRQANDALSELRHEVPDAGGLVLAETQWHAREYVKVLTAITGESPALVVSAEPDAKTTLDAYRDGDSKWIVAVRMVSEGVDIPRLGIGVFASKTQTPLFFRQVVGRIVRSRSGEEFNARLFMPSVPSLARMAHQIEEELRHQLDLEREHDARSWTESQDGQRTFDLRETLSTSDAAFESAIMSGDTYTAEELADAEAACLRKGIPLAYRVGIASLQREQGHVTHTVTVTPTPEPRHRRERTLRSEVETVARKIDYARQQQGGTTNRDLRIKFGPRKSASIETLEAMLAYLATQWREL